MEGVHPNLLLAAAALNEMGMKRSWTREANCLPEDVRILAIFLNCSACIIVVFLSVFSQQKF